MQVRCLCRGARPRTRFVSGAHSVGHRLLGIAIFDLGQELLGVLPTQHRGEAITMEDVHLTVDTGPVVVALVSAHSPIGPRRGGGRNRPSLVGPRSPDTTFSSRGP